uniref:Uncharacterized protein n=1 Tax=Arundo donax TaxID=35708 RepID=A0A0A8XR89_ARUDO
MATPSSPACPSRARARRRTSRPRCCARRASTSRRPEGTSPACPVSTRPAAAPAAGPCPSSALRSATRSARPSQPWAPSPGSPRCPTTRARRWRCATASSCWGTPSTSSDGRSTPSPSPATTSTARRPGPAPPPRTARRTTSTRG